MRNFFLLNKRGILCAALSLAAVILFAACSGSDPEQTAAISFNQSAPGGELTFSVQWQGGPASTERSQAGFGERKAAADPISLTCDTLGITQVTVTIYDRFHTTVIADGSFPCEDHRATLDGIEPGDDYVVLISGIDEAGEILYQGYVSRIDIADGEVTDAGIVLVTYRGFNVSRYTWERDTNGDSEIDRIDTYRYNYDSNGYVTSETIEHDYDLDTTPDYRILQEYSYDNGRLTAFTRDLDTDADGTPDLSYSVTTDYDDEFRLTAYETYQVFSGPAYRRETCTFAYDDSGYLASAVYGRDEGDDGTIEVTNTPDISSVDRVAINGDGGLTFYRHTFDSIGNIVSTAYILDLTADGVMDYRETFSYEQAADGSMRVASLVHESLEDEDYPYIMTCNYEYNASGQEISRNEAYAPLSGSGGQTYTTFTRTYDNNGRLSSIREEDDWGGDGIDSITTTAYGYNDAGNRIAETIENDYDNDGTPNYRYQTAWDSFGTRTSYLQQQYTNGAFQTMNNTTYANSYDPDGNLTSQAEEQLTATGAVIRNFHTYTHESSRRIIFPNYFFCNLYTELKPDFGQSRFYQDYFSFAPEEFFIFEE